jgi:hypothetical protein
MKPWIGVDLDGTLAHYEGWNDGKIGDPIKPMQDRVIRWLAEGKNVKIFTARVSEINTQDITRSVDSIRKTIEEWCLKNLGQVLPITNIKDYGMVELWDDRAVQVIPNTGMTVEEYIKNAS